jgi:outer membrane murein-binding lipoprotein Lpp
MRRNRFLPCGIAVLVVISVLSGCSRGPSEEELAQARFEEQAAQLQQQYEDLQNVRSELAAAEAELAEIEAIAERDRSDEQKAELEGLPARIDELTTARDEAFEATQAALTDFLNTALNEYPSDPATVTGLNIYSDEAILIAEDVVLQAGDYRKAVDQLGSALSYYDSLDLEPYQPLVDKLQEFTEMRFIDQERFDAVTKGMTKDEVKAVAGVPYYQNIQVDEKRGVETWLYRKDDGGAAAFYFRTKTGKVYNKNFDAVKTKVVED